MTDGYKKIKNEFYGKVKEYMQALWMLDNTAALTDSVISAKNEEEANPIVIINEMGEYFSKRLDCKAHEIAGKITTFMALSTIAKSKEADLQEIILGEKLICITGPESDKIQEYLFNVLSECIDIHPVKPILEKDGSISDETVQEFIKQFVAVVKADIKAALKDEN